MSNPFKPGDIVCYTAARWVETELTQGKHYTTIENPDGDGDGDDQWVYVFNDQGETNGYRPFLFEFVAKRELLPDPDFSLDEIHQAQDLVNR